MSKRSLYALGILTGILLTLIALFVVLEVLSSKLLPY
jgi:hypothetical protein